MKIFDRIISGTLVLASVATGVIMMIWSDNPRIRGAGFVILAVLGFLSVAIVVVWMLPWFSRGIARIFPLTRFIPNGFVGLQKESVALEKKDIRAVNTHDRNYRDRIDRIAVYGHLPSFIRIEDMKVELGKKLFGNWVPQGKIEDYVDLVNQRRKAFWDFVTTKKGIVHDVFDKRRIELYVTGKCTMHDRVMDPPEEIIARLEAVRHLLKDYVNYHVHLLDRPMERPGPFYFLKQGVGLVVDLRSADTTNHITGSYDGVFTEDKKIIKQFMYEFCQAHQLSDFSLDDHAKHREEAIDFFEKQLGVVKKRDSTTPLV